MREHNLQEHPVLLLLEKFLRTRARTVSLPLIEENERVKICIENKGTHIALEHLEKIWDRFYRGDTSRQRFKKGKPGLGLAISKNILELHDAEYGVSNTEDGVLFF